MAIEKEFDPRLEPSANIEWANFAENAGFVGIKTEYHTLSEIVDIYFKVAPGSFVRTAMTREVYESDEPQETAYVKRRLEAKAKPIKLEGDEDEHKPD